MFVGKRSLKVTFQIKSNFAQQKLKLTYNISYNSILAVFYDRRGC